MPAQKLLISSPTPDDSDGRVAVRHAAATRQRVSELGSRDGASREMDGKSVRQERSSHREPRDGGEMNGAAAPLSLDPHQHHTSSSITLSWVVDLWICLICSVLFGQFRRSRRRAGGWPRQTRLNRHLHRVVPIILCAPAPWMSKRRSLSSLTLSDLSRIVSRGRQGDPTTLSLPRI
jgi:hypothetical protein